MILQQAKGLICMWMRNTTLVLTMAKDEISEICMKFILYGYELQGRIFLSIARALVKKYGPEVKEVIREASYDNGVRLGRDFSKKFGGNGIREFAKAWEEMWGFGGPPVEVSDRRLMYGGSFCAAYEAWKKMGVSPKEISELADLYCINDVGFAKGFNPKMELKHTKRAMKGDPCCEWVVELKG